MRAQEETFDLVVLDLMLPGRSGLEILQALRQRCIDTPVLVLTARDGVDDRVRGLDLGADDYLVKPFALPELLARIRALLRRGRPADIVRLKTADLKSTSSHGGLRVAAGCSISPSASSICSSICCAIRGTSCRAKCWRARCGRSRVERRQSTTSSTSR